MPYTGSGANKVPISKINPILLGRKKDSDGGGGGQPSLLSQHLNRKREAEPASQGQRGDRQDFQREEPWNRQQGGGRGGFHERGNFEQRGGFNQRGGFQQRGGYNQGNPRHEGNFREDGNYNQDRNFNYDRRNNQDGNYGQQRGNFNQDGNRGNYNQGNYNSQGYGNQSSNYGDSNRQMNSNRNPQPQPLMSLSPTTQQPFNQSRNYNMPQMPPAMPPSGFPPVMPPGIPPPNFPAAAPGFLPPAGFTAPPPPMPPTNSSFNQPPPPPSFGDPPPPPTSSKFQSEPPAPPPPSSTESSNEPAQPKKRKRKSRWGDVEEKTNIPGMPASLPSNVTPEQKEQYLLHFKIEEISIKLRSGDLGIPANPEDRSPSPEPIYNTEGKRLNTREFRVRKALEEERHSLIEKATETNKDYRPPIDYKPPSNRIQEKVMIPQDSNPAINFIGLLIGPRGNTLKKMEKETSCKIIIRGKGSVKEGKGRPGFPLPGENEPLHALVTGPTHEDVKNAVKVIEKIVKEGVETPEGSNELRKMQLRELAALNGTLIEEDIQRCRNCGATDHRHWECTEVKNVTSQVICTKCGGYGHLNKDCTYTSEEKNVAPQQNIVEKAKMDDEYMSLMAELGVDAPAGSSAPPKPAGGTTTAKQEPAPLALPPPPQPDNLKANSSAPAPWKPEPKPLMESTPFEPRGQPAPKPLMQSYPSNGPPPPSSSQAPWRPGPNQPPGDSYNSPRPGGQHGAAPLWSQPAPPPWQQPPASGYNMPPMGGMYPQASMPPWAAPPPPPPPPSK